MIDPLRRCKSGEPLMNAHTRKLLLEGFGQTRELPYTLRGGLFKRSVACCGTMQFRYL